MTDKISDALIDEMLAGLEGVTPGPWEQTSVPEDWSVDTGSGNYYGGVGPANSDPVAIVIVADSFSRDAEQEANQAHFARCSPETIRALLLELRAYRTAANPLQAVLDKFPDKPASAIEITDEMVERFMVSWYGDNWQRVTQALASFEDARRALTAAMGDE